MGVTEQYGNVARRVDGGCSARVEYPRQGSMNRFRKIIFIGGFLAAVMALAPTLATASSLLSGYGGPGQGNQAILGSALLNGPSGGGGSGGGSSGGGAEGAGRSSTSTATSATGGETAATGSAKGAPAGSGAAPTGNSGTGSGTGSGAAGARGASGAGSAPRKTVAAVTLYPASERLPASQQTGTLGLSTADLLYIILAAGTLAFVGVFTSRLTRTDAPGRHR